MLWDSYKLEAVQPLAIHAGCMNLMQASIVSIIVLNPGRNHQSNENAYMEHVAHVQK
jgi:hypothetical protein